MQLGVHLARKWYKMCIKKAGISKEVWYEKIYS